MKLTLATAALVMSLSGFATAASISAAANLDLNFTTNAANAGSALTTTYTAKIGWFNGSPLTTEATFATINAGWTNAGDFAFASGAMAGFDGYFQTPGLIFTDAAGLAGKNVWVWATNGSNQNLLMQATGVGAGDFLFKSDSDIPSGGAVGIRNDNKASWQLALGTFTASGTNAVYGGSYVLNTAAAIPETSAALLGAFGALGLLRRRRN